MAVRNRACSLLRPAQAGALINQSLQVANLMLQAELMRGGGRIQLGFPAIALPDFGAALAHEGVDHVLPATGRDQVILQPPTHKHPFPVIAAMDAGAGFITANHAAVPHLLTNGFGQRAGPPAPARSMIATAPPSLSVHAEHIAQPDACRRSKLTCCS